MSTSAHANTPVEKVSSCPSRVVSTAAWLAILLTILCLVLLASLHILSPEFAPSWRMISEYALGRYGWVLSLMFVCLGMSPWALAVALRPHVRSSPGKAGLWLLIVAGLGGVMASYFDITHEVGHATAGLLGVLGFPIGAVVVSVSLGRDKTWRGARRGLLWLANLSWMSVVLLVATMALMTIQFRSANGGHLPEHAPKSLPPGVLGLDGWADRLIVLSNCAWVLFAAGHVIKMQRKES